MHISAYIMPRRVILALLILLGLFLRLWGLSWPQEQGAYYPEWGEQVIANISMLEMVYREEIWTQGLYGLAYLIKGVLAGLAGWVEVWLGLARVSSEVNLHSLLAGRLAVALMGTAQVWLAYQVARRWFNSLGTGLVAAAWLAVSPLMVMESHYLATGVPLGFMTLICLWCAHALQRRFAWWHFILAGLCLGFTLTIKASGILIAPVFLWAFWLAWRQRRPSWRLLLLWLLCFLFGLWLGLTLGSPGFVLMLFRMHRNVWDSLLLPPLLDGAGWQYVADRAWQLYELMDNWVGWLWLGLWLTGLVTLFVKKNLLRFSLVFFPVLYLAAAIFLLSSPVENLLAAIMPLFIILAAWPIVLLCRRIPGRLLPGWILVAITIILLSYPLLNSLRISYLFWQQPALNSALGWARSNLPQMPDMKHDADSQYLLLLSQPKQDDLQVIKTFDLVSDWAPPWLPQGLPLARPYTIYANLPPITSRQPLGYARLPINPDASFSMVFADNMAYSRGEGSVFMERPTVVQRLLRLEGNSTIKVRLRNQGASLAMVQLMQGPWLNRFVELYPGQETSLEFRAKAWPQLMGHTYPISFRLHQGAQVWADWQWDPLQTAFQEALHNQPFDSGLLYDDQPFEARVLLALNASRQQNWPQTKHYLQNLDNSLFALAQNQDDPQWFARLAAYAGLYPLLLQNAGQRFYPMEPSTPEQDRLQIFGQGFSGTLERPRQDQEGWLTLTLDDKLSTGHWLVGIELTGKTSQPLEVELWGREKLAQGILEESTLYLPFTQPENAYPVRVKIKLPQKGVFFKGITLACDLKAHMRQLYSWYLEASARMYLHQGQYSQALQALQARRIIVNDLIVNDLPAEDDLANQTEEFANSADTISWSLESELLHLQLNAQMGAGLTRQAMVTADRLRHMWQNFPEKLALLREVYQNLGHNERLPELGRRIVDLRPSISKSTGFINGLTLLGYDGPAANEVRPGTMLSYNFYWQASQPPYMDCDIFLQLLGPGIDIIQTHRLRQGHTAMTSLKAGEVIRESRQFAIPDNLAPGTYRMIMGLWDKEYKNQRLNIVEGEARGRNDLQLFSLEVK